MSIDTPPIPPAGETEGSNRNRKILLGCLIALILILVILCCGITSLLMPLFTDYDPLGTGLRERIEEFIPVDILEDTDSIPSLDELLEEVESNLDEYQDDIEIETQEPTEVQDIPLAIFYFRDVMTSFYYPVGWDIEMEGYTVTFYHPEDFTYIYVGEFTVEEGSTAEEVAFDYLATIEEDAQEGSFQVLSSSDYSVPLPGDAHLVLFEWIDQDGYYGWAYDLEIVQGETNLFLLLFGEIEEEIEYYGELLDIIASSLEPME